MVSLNWNNLIRSQMEKLFSKAGGKESGVEKRNHRKFNEDIHQCSILFT